MPSPRRLKTEILFGGGWATDFGPNFSGGPDQSGRISVPWLVNAENITYEMDGGPHKIGGSLKLNSSAVASGAAVMGLFDYWKSGTTGTPVQKRVIHAGTSIYKEDLDGTFDSLFTGLESGKVPSYTVFDDILIMASDSTVDVPKSWDQTTAQSLAGTPPNFAFSTQHKNRAWAAGVVGFPSRLYYSVLADPEDWAGAGSGSIDISPDDGDRIVGIYGDHRDVLWVFKGPNKGSIHYITGSSPTDFARVPFSKGIPCANHNGIVAFGDDLAFVSTLGIHSLAATDKYGNFVGAFLSNPFGSWYRQNIKFGDIKFCWGTSYQGRRFAVWTMRRSGQTQNDIILMMDYWFSPPRWSVWYQPTAACLAMVLQNGVPELWCGDYSGFVRRLDRPNRDMDGTAYTARATLPYMNFGSSQIEKTAATGYVGIAASGNYNLTLGWARDNLAQQTTTVSQAGGDVLGVATANQFTLGTSTLAGARYVTQPAELSGDFRDIQLEVSQGGADEDMEVHSIGFHADVGAVVEDTV